MSTVSRINRVLLVLVPLAVVACGTDAETFDGGDGASDVRQTNDGGQEVARSHDVGSAPEADAAVDVTTPISDGQSAADVGASGDASAIEDMSANDVEGLRPDAAQVDVTAHSDALPADIAPVLDAPSPVLDSSVVDSVPARDAPSEQNPPRDAAVDQMPPALPTGIAIVSSDSTTTALSLATVGGAHIDRDECVTSSTVSSHLSIALSENVVLPTAPQPNHEVALIDRKNSTITWVSPQTCEVLRQINVSPGFASKPLDLIAGLPGGKAYVTRYATNPSDAGQGGDVLIINASTGATLGRIDLRAYVSSVTPPAAPLLPFPARGLVMNGKVYVVLSNLTMDRTGAGVGRVVEIDPATDQITRTIEFPGLTACEAIAPVDSSLGTGRFLVGCEGRVEPSTPGWPLCSPQTNSECRAGGARVDPRTDPATTTILVVGERQLDDTPVSASVVAALDPDFVTLLFPAPPSPSFPIARFWSYSYVASPSTSSMGNYTANLSVLSLTHDVDRHQVYILDAHLFGTVDTSLVKVYPVNVPMRRPLEVPLHPDEGETPLATYPPNPAGGRQPHALGFY